MTQQYQGDISIVKIEKAPDGLKFEETKKDTIVAYGEKSGHKHTLTYQDRTDTSYQLAKVDNGYYLITDSEMLLTHNQHKTQVITPGTYWIGKQFEYDEISKLRVVRD